LVDYAQMVRVLFVCLGNICRSPLAQGVFEDVLRREGLEDEVFVDSAQRARRISSEDCEEFDYVLTMDEQNYQAVAALCRGGAVVRPFLDFAPHSPEREVPDPYGGGPDSFEHVLDLVEEASEGLLDDIRDRHLTERG
jgi:protein-tyrosine phosphatase